MPRSSPVPTSTSSGMVRPSRSSKPEHHVPTPCPPVPTAESCSSSPSELVEHSSIWLLNIQSFNPSAHSTSRSKATYLEDELRKEQAKNHTVPLIALTETWLKSYIEDAQLQIPGYSLFSSDREARVGGGVLLYTHDKLPISESTLKCPIPQSYIKRLIDDKVTRLNQETWLTDGPRHTKLTLGHKHANIIKNLNTTLSNNRQNYRTAVHLITGHCGLNKHLHTIRKSSTSACPMCGDEEETVSHFLGQCPAIAQIRGQYFQDYYLSVNDIFDNQHISTIINFTNRTKRLVVPEELDQTGVT